MAERIRTDDVRIDARTSRAVADGIGEKLRQALGTEPRFPDRLQTLLEALRDREARDASAALKGG